MIFQHQSTDVFGSERMELLTEDGHERQASQFWIVATKDSGSW